MKAATPAPKRVDTERKKLYSLIEVGCSQLALDEDTKRQMFETLTRRRSKKDMDLFQLRAVLTHLRDRGFAIISPAKAKMPVVSQTDQADKIEQLWRELHEAGRVRDPSISALRAWVSSASAPLNGGVGVSDPQMLTTLMAQRLIERLKKWLGRK